MSVPLVPLSTSHPPTFQDLLLEPTDNERLGNLCGQLDEHLRQIERRLGVEINNRGHQFRVIGEPATVVVAVAVLEALYRSTGEEILTPERVHLFLQEAGVDALIEPESETDEVTIRTRRGLIRGRGPTSSATCGTSSITISTSGSVPPAPAKPIWRWPARWTRWRPARRGG
jgi:phosphate starvation-inducible protein PhoH and related proteins